MATVKEWSNAYARQAKADFMTYQALESLRSEAVLGWSIPICHKLQFLQMACEKLAKAHLCTRGTAPASLQASHAYISKVLPVVIRQEMVAVNFRGKSAKNLGSFAATSCARNLVASPSVRRGGQRPDNCEYPCEDIDGRDTSLSLGSFCSAQLIAQPAGRSMLKLIQSADERLAT